MIVQQQGGFLFLFVAIAAALIGGSGSVHAVSVNISYLEGTQPVAPDAVTAWGPELFGDKVNLFNGALEFEQTDTRLPGNSSLSVALTRRFVPGRPNDVRGQFGDWDLEAPRMGGSFASLNGWVTSSGGSNRCTGYSMPPGVSAGAGGIASFPGAGARTLDKAPAIPTLQAGSASPDASGVVGFIASDYWQGTSISIPGLGSQEVLQRSPSYTRQPADGRAYALVTRGNWQLGCLPGIQNGAGEGFTAITPDGVRYRFDWMASRYIGEVKKSGANIGRADYFLMATEVTDRFGNWVRYTYDPASPLLLRRIEASDGRVITVTNSGGRAIAVNDGTRNYVYGYTADGRLQSVVQPDGSRWTFNLGGMTATYLGDMGEGANCDRPGTLPPDNLDGTITHPSGAVGTFKTMFVYLGRTFVDRVCRFAPGSNLYTTGAVYPQLFGSQALIAKSITGPGMADMNWSYSYSVNYGWNPCKGCNDRRTVIVTDPGGSKAAHHFGTRWRVNEGQLLQVDEGWTGAAWLKSTAYRYRTADAQKFPDQFGSSLLSRSDYLAARNRPQDQRVVTQQGATFSWQADASAAGFDELARPAIASQFSSLSPNYKRTEATEYHDSLPLWVLGQRKRLVELTTNREVERHTFHDATALKKESYSFGLRTNSFAYRADGTLETLYDAANRAIAFQNFMRGKPQRAVFADGIVASRVVNNLGNVVSETNEAGTTTGYTFDTMGRVASISYPTGDPVVYAPTIQSFNQMFVNEYGLAPGHWRQSVSTGSGYRYRYFDALWRVRLDVSYDANNTAGTLSFKEMRYDADNRKSFEGYPSRLFSVVDQAIAGISTTYDGLDRVVQQRADSELGPLTTTTENLTGFQRRVTNPRGFATTHTFQAFDSPSEDRITSIALADGSWVSIPRDIFGKPLSIARGGTFAGNAQRATRSYVYDAYQRLCKTIEPETGATVQQHDVAGNLSWRASGLNLPSASSCDQSSVPSSRMVAFSYDARDRLLNTTYGDGSPGIARTYTADGLLNTMVSGGSSWGYSYNNRRLLAAEALLASPFSSASLSVGYAYDTYGKARYLVYPDGTTIDYGNNALGQPTQVSGYATGVAYHPNGTVSNYMRGNGRAHYTTLNLRGLPSQRRDDAMLWDVYTYDANGNVTGISDWQEGISSRTMGYDALDRLTAANGVWGSGTFSYDTLDNLRTSVVGARTLTHQYTDGTNRLTGLVGSQNIGFGYDANGNITQRGSQGFVFDIGNRIQRATGKASYSYDGHGRRYWVQNSDGSWKLQFYSQSGKLLLSWSSSEGQTKHLYLGDKLLAEVNSTSGVSYLHADALGSPVAKSSTGGGLVYRTRYEPYGATAAGTNPLGIGFTGHVNDGDTGLVYMQQRYYDPVVGRFLSVDPVTTDAKTGSSFNRYVYGNNNPYRFKDPDGRFAIPLIPLIIEAVVAAVGSNAGAAAVGIAGGVAIGAAINQSQNSSGSAAPGPSSGQQVSAPPPGTQSSSQGCIYCVKGENTSSGRDYVGSTDNMGQRAKDTSDGRNREGAPVVGTYDKGDKQGRRNAEQQAINDRGGVDKLDNKRNEVAPKSWGDQGIKPPETSK